MTPLQRLEVQRLTEDNGFGLPQAETGGWAAFKGLSIPHTLWITPAGPEWLIGIAHAGVMEAVTADIAAAPTRRPDDGPAVAVDELGPMIRRMARLARSLPTAPLEAFLAQSKTLPSSTEMERLAVQRIGQSIFRDALLDFWSGRCPLTGITHPRLLRASHMKPWKDATDAERLDVHNGLLLAAHLDAAFDAGLITFSDDGTLQVSNNLQPGDRDRLGLACLPPLTGLRPQHVPYLAHHRACVALK